MYKPAYLSYTGVLTALVLAIGSALLAYIIGSLVIPLAIVGLLAALLGAAWVIVRPIRFVYLILLILPFHIMIMVFLFGFMGLSQEIVRGLASWKDATLCLLIFTIILGIVLSGKKRFQLASSDVFAYLFLLQLFLYLVFGSVLLGSKVQLVGRLYGLRDSGALFACYLLGRAIECKTNELERLFKVVLTVASIISIIGLVEWIFLPDEFFVFLGVSTYFSDFLGVDYTGEAWGQGLPANFWTYMGSSYVRRSVSVYMSSQGFAITFLVVLPISVYFMLYKSKDRRKSFWIFVLNAVALLATITRTTIIACIMVFFIMAKLAGKSGWVKKGFLGALLLFVLGVVFSPGVRTLIMETITWKSDSSVSHVGSWQQSLHMLEGSPIFGYGLSEAGQNSARFGGRAVGEENVFFRVVGEMGSIGLLLYIGFWVTCLAELGGMFSRGNPLPETNGLIVLGIAFGIGFLINSLTADILSSTYPDIAIGFFLGMIRNTVGLEKCPAGTKGMVVENE